MKPVQYSEMVSFRKYRVEQHFSSGTSVITEGLLTSKEDEYLWIQDANNPLNIHPYVGMPNVYIYEVQHGENV